jgi:hypothetical protein
MDRACADIQRQWVGLQRDPTFLDPSRRPLSGLELDCGVEEWHARERMRRFGGECELWISEDTLTRGVARRPADLLVGYILDSPQTACVSVHLRSGDMPEITRVPLRAGIPTPALLTHWLPLRATHYAEFLIFFDRNARIRPVYATLQESVNTRMDDTIVYMRLPDDRFLCWNRKALMCSILSNAPPQRRAIYIPETIAPWREMVSIYKRLVLGPIEEELVAKAWHPRRLVWCLDMDESHMVTH